ncbi:MAG: Mov34/MPN/PAD-1 family protein [Nitrososphaera sp.]
MIFDSKTKRHRIVTITRQVADGIITYSKARHPYEAILVLQGKNTKDQVVIDRLVIPPFAMSGPYYSGFPVHDLPFDLSYIGTAHSHPGGSNRPSLEDLNHFFGVVSIIISHPYEDETIGAFDRDGNALELKIVDSL